LQDLLDIERAGGKARLKQRIGRDDGFGVPGADVLADVAAVKPLTDRAVIFGWDLVAMLDGQIGDALSRIELIGRGDRAGRTGVDAAAAGAAAVDGRIVGWQIERRDDLPQQQPASDPLVDRAGVLSLPADPGSGGQLLFHHRRRVDACARHSIGTLLANPVRQGVQAFLDDLVIIHAQRVARDAPMPMALVLRHRRQRHVIVHRHADHAARPRHVHGWIGPLVEAPRHPRHRPVLSLVQPAPQVIPILRRLGPRDPHQLKPQLARTRLDRAGEHVRISRDRFLR